MYVYAISKGIAMHNFILTTLLLNFYSLLRIPSVIL